MKQEKCSRLCLVRHAESRVQTEEETGADPNLSKHGIEQAQCLAERLGQVKFDKIYLSPLKRTRQTFEHSSISRKGKIVCDSRIVEFGDYKEILPYNDLPDYAEPDKQNAWGTHPRERLSSFLMEMDQISRVHSNILVISHTMALSYMFNIFMHGNVDEYDGEKRISCLPGNASISILMRSPKSERFDTMRLWNCQKHLERLPGFKSSY